MKLYTIGTQETETVGHGDIMDVTVIRPLDCYGTDMPKLFKNRSEAQDVINSTPFNHNLTVVELVVE